MDLFIAVRFYSSKLLFDSLITVHANPYSDPHIGNILVRQHPTRPGKPQLVLLDHGLYRDLTESFRRSYCRLWGALVSSNVPDIAKYCEELNVGQAYPLMASMLTMKSWDDITSNDLSRFYFTFPNIHYISLILSKKRLM